MRFCKEHWSTLRAAIDERGLSHLIPKDGKAAAAAMRDEMENGRNPSNYDPLMASHWAIANNAMSVMAGQYSVDPLIMLTDDVTPPELQCPICGLNWLHEQHDRNCVKPDCSWPKAVKWDWMIERAADDAKEEAERLRLESA